MSGIGAKETSGPGHIAAMDAVVMHMACRPGRRVPLPADHPGRRPGPRRGRLPRRAPTVPKQAHVIHRAERAAMTSPSSQGVAADRHKRLWAASSRRPSTASPQRIGKQPRRPVPWSGRSIARRAIGATPTGYVASAWRLSQSSSSSTPDAKPAMSWSDRSRSRRSSCELNCAVGAGCATKGGNRFVGDGVGGPSRSG